jgi:hypothetical protein
LVGRFRVAWFPAVVARLTRLLPAVVTATVVQIAEHFSRDRRDHSTDDRGDHGPHTQTPHLKDQMRR